MPIVETLESYSRALLPLRAFVRRPFQAVTDSFRFYGPRIAEIHRQLEMAVLGTPFVLLDKSTTTATTVGGAGSVSSSAVEAGSVGATASSSSSVSASAAGSGSRIMLAQPSFLNYFTSSYALLMFFVSIVLNRINAIVAPRNPHPLKLSLRFALKIPAFYLLIKSALVTGALLATNSPLLPFEWPEMLQTKMSNSSALFLCLTAMGVSYTTDTFIANLQSAGTGEQNFNMVEMSLMFHFTPQGKDVLLVAFIQVCQLLSLQMASLFPQGRQYRLAITSFWGMMDMAHFVQAVYRRSITYPSMQLFTCMPEAVVILMVAISLCVHGLTYLVTGGNVRRRMFEQRALPSRDEEYGIAVFKFGRACLEATRGVGFWNEVDAVVIPFGTILDKRRVRITTTQSDTSAVESSSSFTSTPGSTSVPDAGSNQHLWTATFQQQPTVNPPMPSVPTTGFSHEVPDEVDVPGQRQHVSRRQTRLTTIRGFFQSTIYLFLDIFFAVYNRVVPARYRRRRRIVVRPIAATMSIQEYLQLRNAIEAAMQQAGRPASPEAQHSEADEFLSPFGGGLRTRRRRTLQPEEEERIYSQFLTDRLSDEDEEDESDSEYIPPEASEDEADSDAEPVWQGGGDVLADQEVLPEQLDELHLYEDCSGEEDSIEEENATTTSRSALGSLQDFLLDSSFLSIFLSGQGRDQPLTRSQHRRTIEDPRWESGVHSDDEEEPDSMSQAAGRESRGISSIRSRRSHLAQRSRGSLEQSSSKHENAELLALLQKHRKTAVSLQAPSDSPANPIFSTSSSAKSPPPMAAMPTNPEDSSFYGRLLCVVCQSEPRNVLLRPCRCLALCNDCRELLAIRRFKQCPCCRSEVQGFSKIFLP